MSTIQAIVKKPYFLDFSPSSVPSSSHPYIYYFISPAPVYRQVPNTASAELERSYTLLINDQKSEDEIRIKFENTAKDWKILSSGPFKSDDVLRSIIQFGTTNPNSDAKYYINAGMARIRQDANFKSNRDEGIPEIHLVDYGFLSTHGHKKAGGIYPARFGFLEPTTQGNFQLEHSVSVECP